MPSLKKALNSQVGKKIMTGITGIGLMLFLIGHLAGNLTILKSNEVFNIYAKTLHDFGPFLYVIELGLAFFFLYHTILGVSIWWTKRKARPEGYDTYKSRGGASHQSIASKSMIYTGTIILIFLILHIIHFKFGTEYSTTIDGEKARDLAKLMIEEFSKGWVVIGYVGVLALVVLHLSHGAWSAFTSLGMKHGETSKKVQMGAYVFAIALMLGFIAIPVIIYFNAG